LDNKVSDIIDARCNYEDYEVQGGALQRIDTSRYYRGSWKKCTDI